MAAFFLDMGLGKTTILLAMIKILIEKKIIKRVLIIAPLRVCWTVWPVESKKWTDFEELRVEVLHGPKKDAALERDADIYVINPDGLEWLSLENRHKKLKADMLVVDESDMFKRSDTLRSKLLKYLLPTFKRRYILTGTPAPNGLIDLFGQVYILDQGAALGRYITHYRRSFFEQSGYGGYTWTLRDGAKEEIYERLRPLALRMEAADYLELPERVDNVVYVDLPDKVRRTYLEIEHTFLTLLENGETIVTPSAAAASMKLRQITNGAVYRSLEHRLEARVHTEEWVALHDAKLDALEEIVGSRQGKPVLVAYEFEHDADRLRKRFKDAVFVSDYPGNKVEELVRRWNAGEILMLCAHPQSAGHGLNLQEGKDTIVWLSPSWRLDLDKQFNARVLRQGNSSSHVFIHYIVARRTIDEVVMKTLAIKDATQSDLLAALKDYAKEVKE